MSDTADSQYLQSFRQFAERPSTDIDYAMCEALTLLRCGRTPLSAFGFLVTEGRRHFHKNGDGWPQNKCGDEGNNNDIFNKLHQVLLGMSESLVRMEKIMVQNSAALTRAQADVEKLVQANNDLKTSFNDFKTANQTSNDRLLKEIQDLRTQVGGTDQEDAINAIADRIENIVTDNNTMATDLAAMTSTEGTIGTDPQQPPPTQSVTISPKTATVTPGNPQQFTTNIPVTFSAQNGSIDQNGVYTAPPDPSVTSDVVTATSQADASQVDSASITIQQPQQ